MASTSAPATDLRGQPVDSARIESLESDLAFEKTILASFEDAAETPETAQEKTATKRKIMKLKQQLSEARGIPLKASQPTTGVVKNNTGKMDYLQLPVRFPQLPSPSGMSTPSDSSSSGGPSSHHGGTISRKRSFSNAQIGAPVGWTDTNKSRRTTPSPMNSTDPTPSPDPFDDFDDLPVIDLTGDDDEWKAIIKRHKQAEDRLSINKVAIERDAAMARELQSGVSPPAPNQSLSSSSPRQMTAFDRINGRTMQLSRPSSQLNQYNVKREPELIPSAHVYGQQHGSVQPEPRYGSNQHNSLVKNEPRYGSNQNNSLVKNESGYPGNASHNAPSSSRLPQVKPEYNANSYHMPGSFVDDDDLTFLGQSPLTNGMHSAPFGGYSQQFPASGSSQQIGQPQSGFAQYAQGQAFKPYSSLFTQRNGVSNYSQLASTFDLGTNLAGPGLINNGYNMPPPFPGPPLADTISRTQNYDWAAMTDGEGKPLNSRLANYIDDYVNDPRKTEEEIQQLLSNIKPDMDLPEEARGETPEALRYPLYVHQQLALTWMVNMEQGSSKGGILADDMGLGKTISTLALMVTRPSETNVKTNLIIGPVALIRQWEHEIQKKLKSSHSLVVFNLYGKKVTYPELKRADVALTTYGSVASEWKKYNRHLAARTDSAGYRAVDDEELQKLCPLLHPKSLFYRVILDEAQLIKNKDTQSSQGVHQINAIHRWCLTGTPMMNGVTELYPLIRFLRIKPYCNPKSFTDAFKSLTPKAKVTDQMRSNAMKQLQAILKAIMLRRMKNSEIDGKPILTLPEKTETAEVVVFSPDELSFYKDLEARSQVQFNKYLRAGTVGKNYSNILVLLLRLRQACCHPHLMDFECIGATEVSEDQMMALAKGLESTVIERIKNIAAFECPICYDAVEDPTILVPCGHDTCSECFASLTDSSAQANIRSGQEVGAAKCPVCRGPAETTKTISYSTFQKVHMADQVAPETADDVLIEEYNDDSDDVSDSDDSDLETASDVGDTESLGSLEDFIVRDDDENDKGKARVKKAKTEKKKAKAEKKEKPIKKMVLGAKAKGKGKAAVVKPEMLKTLRHEAGKNKEARRRYMHYLRDNWEDSAKVTKVLELLEEIQESDEKTIIFSQWTMLLDLIECQVKSKLQAKYCRYTGGMSRKQRDESVQDFVENPKTKIMLVSLRAGNAGLNLTVASHVIICDPFWNPYIEMQAVDRAHRIGQQREVKVHRILIKETVEDRIIELQERKRELVDAALDEGESKSLGRLSERELAYLFGMRPAPRR